MWTILKNLLMQSGVIVFYIIPLVLSAQRNLTKLICSHLWKISLNQQKFTTPVFKKNTQLVFLINKHLAGHLLMKKSDKSNKNLLLSSNSILCNIIQITWSLIKSIDCAIQFWILDLGSAVVEVSPDHPLLDRLVLTSIWIPELLRVSGCFQFRSCIAPNPTTLLRCYEYEVYDLLNIRCLKCSKQAYAFQ